MKSKFLLIVISIIFLSSCSRKIPFTHNYRERITSSNEKNVEKLQYYNDRNIELVYRTSSRDESIRGGKVKFKDGYYIYTIEIKKGTKAIAKNFDAEKLKVYFEREKFLFFIKDGKYAYRLAGQQKGRKFLVTYENKEFIPEKGADARLLFKKNRKITTEEDKRKAKGVKLR